MSDYFTLDPDYQDFDFADWQKIKFMTLYGEQRGTPFESFLALLMAGTFLCVLLADYPLEVRYGGLSADICLFSFVLILSGYYTYSALDNLITFARARRQHTRLTQQFVMLNGKIHCINTVSGLRHSAGYYIEVEYRFFLNGRTLWGRQIKQRDDLRYQTLPLINTPVKILYGDENAYVML